MTTISIRDLRYDFPKVEALLHQVEEIQITKRGKAIARLIAEKPDYPPLPDFRARVRKIYGDRVFEVSGAKLISEDRDRL